MLIWNFWPGPEGGAERQCRKIVKALQQHGVSSTVVTRWSKFTAPLREGREGVEVVRLGSLGPIFEALWDLRDTLRRRRLDNASYALSEGSAECCPSRLKPGMILLRLERMAFMRAARMLFKRRHRDFDLIHVHENHWLAGFAVSVGEELGLPVLIKEATFPVLPLDDALPNAAKFDVLRKKAAHLALTKEAADALASDGIAPDRIFLVPNGVEIHEMPVDGGEKDVVGFVGNERWDSFVKGFDVLLDAWEMVIRAKPESKLLVAGRMLKEDIRRHFGVQRSRAMASVEAVGWISNVDDFYKRLGLFVLPSRREGLSNALLEAQSYGIPAVVSDIPGNRAVVEHGRTGLVVPVGDAGALAHAVIGMLSDRDARRRMGVAARDRILRDFSIETTAHRLLDVYGTIIARPRGS